MKRLRNIVIGATVAALVASACSSDTAKTSTTGGLDGDAGDCITVDMAISPEKLTVLVARAVLGQSMFHPADARYPGDSRPLNFARAA